MCYLAAVLVSLNSTIWWLVPSADKTQLNHPFKPRGHTRVNKGLQDERRKWELFSVTVLVVPSGEIHSPKIKWHGLTRALTVWCSLSASQTDFLHSAQELAQHPFWLWGDFWGRVEGQIQAFFWAALEAHSDYCLETVFWPEGELTIKLPECSQGLCFPRCFTCLYSGNLLHSIKSWTTPQVSLNDWNTKWGGQKSSSMAGRWKHL